MERAGPDRVGERERVARAFDVCGELRLRIGRDVVERREMEEVLDLSAERFRAVGRDAEVGLRNIADDRNETILAGAKAFDEILELAERFPAHEAMDRAFAREQFLDEPPADETRRSGDEIAHGALPDASTVRSKA